MTISFTSPRPREAKARGAGVTAVLGPTNTGKTHLAIERMLAHSSGLIGLPLRLLAREVYTKIVARAGAENVALITGEEKIKPPHARYWVSTVEAMPRDLDVAFLAVDEVQLAADFERGHVFTDRMLNRRGREETLVLGAATMRPMIEKLLPGANIVGRPRLSLLSFAGEKKLTRLPRRSAIVAFSAEEVYAIAELIRRQRGGAAVVLGALSPRTRNAQVALYQSGDVDYLVATDAIGMGLNLDVDHVAFAADRKFDGYQYRKLNPAELAQIAGRAGRATHDGTFGTTGRCEPFEQDLVRQLESHTFGPVRLLQWRNTTLDFSSLGALQATLAVTPKESGLTRAPIAEDILVLEHAARDEAVRAMAASRAAVSRLWDVCQVPDYRKIAPATHAELVTTLYGFLMREGSIPKDWFAAQVAQADRTDGGIDTLSNRIAHVRTWTFVANRPDWLADPEHWQGVTRAVEDKLSDALHERLAERFVDRRTSVLMRRLREDSMLETEIGKTGEVTVEGHAIGRLEGFVFAADASAGGPEAKALQATAQKALAGEIDARAVRLSQAGDEQFVLASDGALRWMGDVVGKLTASDDMLHPRVRVVADEQLTGASREAVQTRLDLWLKTHIEKLLAPLFALSSAEDVIGLARGIAFQLVEAFGVLDRQRVAEDVKTLDQDARASLRKYGVRFGAYHIYMPNLLKPAPRLLAAQLWALKNEGPQSHGLDELRALATGGRTSMPADESIAKPLYRVAGYRVCGTRAVRVDILERLADLIRPALVWREGVAGEKPPGAIEGFGFTVAQNMTSLTGAAGEDFASILKSLGYRMERRPKPPEAQTPPDAAKSDAPAEASETESANTDAASADVEATNADAMPAAGPPHDEAAPAIDATGESAVAMGIAPAQPDAPPPETVETQPEAREAGTHQTETHETPQDAGPHAASDDSAEAASPAAAEAAPVETTEPAETVSLTAPQAGTETADAATAGAGDEARAETADASAAPVATEPEFIEVWRPGRAADEHRQHRPPPRARRGRSAQGAAQKAAAPSGEAADGGAPSDGQAAEDKGERPHRRGRRRHGSSQGQDRPAAFAGTDGDKGGRDRKPGEQHDRGKNFGGKNFGGKDFGGKDFGGKDFRGKPRKGEGRKGDAYKGDSRKGERTHGEYTRPPREVREKTPDPNSPFAKLAALKAQLEGRKDSP